ncbi:MAG: AsmA family protein [Hyphomicrobium sp.]|nr:AsmA family protein [Hyphomicrobium sp.]
MTSNQPPRRPPGPPSLGAYRPSTEAGPGGHARTQPVAMGPGHPPTGGRPPHQPPPGYRPPPPGGRAPPPHRPPPHRQGPPDGGGGGILKIAAIALFAIVGLAAAGAAALYLLGPADLVRDQIVARVKQQTGRDLLIKGATKFSFYPSLGVSMSDVALSAPPGMEAPPLVTIKTLTASVALKPLLNRRVEVEEVRLDEPVLTLQVDRNGRKSWEFASAGVGDAPLRYAQATDPAVATDAPAIPPQTGAPAAPRIEKLSLGRLRITRGTALYSDQRTGTTETVSGMDLTIAAPSFEGTATANGSLFFRDEALDLTSEITSPAEFLKSSSGRIVAQVKGAPLDLRYEGTARFIAGADLEGNLALSAPSVERLAAFVQKKPRTGGGADDPIAVTGKLSSSSNTWTLSGATGAIGRTKGNGDVSVTTGGARPIVKANLKFAEIDLNAILGDDPTSARSTAAPQPAPAPAAKPVAPVGPRSIEDLLKDNPAAPGTAVRGFTQRSGWSEQPYDFAGLMLVDADAGISVGRLFYKDIKIGQSIVTLALKGGVLKVDFTDIQLYGGRGKGLVAIDASDLAIPRLTANVAFDGVEGLPLLSDAAGLDWLSGKARIVAGVTGQGRNQAAVMNSLGGSADISYKDGAIIGINIPGLLRNIGQGKLSGLSSSPTEKTDFSEMTSSWAINNGVARNSDLKLVGPLIRVTGQGAVKLGERTLDYTMRTKIVADTRGQGGPLDIGGLEVPIKISGPWEKPKFAPDVGGVLKDPEKAVETIKEIGKQFKGKDAKELLRGILGGGGQPAPQQ